ncbi:Ark- serine/threonine protein kinase [Oleoguttula sp. CCFEE 5521]
MASTLPHRPPTYRAPAATPAAPQGTFLPGTKVQVGSHRVVIEKYLSEGGFAHVYVVRVPREDGKHELAVLKRVAVPDKDHLASMRTEVETMKKLKGHGKIVTYYDSHASQLKGGGYEVFLLMEYCSGGGLIDFMNTRLQHRLTEPEILKIFADVAEGVACMHYLKPPLLHRDLKVENVLISKSASGGATYKLCDFGSTAAPRPAATTAEEGRLIEEDVQKHTTMQYRSPEMVDVWRKQPIDEKADVWALGVLLYKLCYYTTPFEEVGQMAILNATFKFPSYPQFSPRLRKFISWMLKEDPKGRPTIYEVIKEAASMRGAEVPIKDIYADRTRSEARRTQEMPPSRSTISSSTAAIGLQKAQTRTEEAILPGVTPMRRGRPTAAQLAPTAVKPAASPARGDPFAALDSKNLDTRSVAVDELSQRFPAIDEFSIVNEKAAPFKFTASQPSSASVASGNLGERVVQALADDAFKGNDKPSTVSKSKSAVQLQQKTTASPTKLRSLDRPQEIPPSQSLSTTASGRYKSTAVGSSPPRISSLQPTVSAAPAIKSSEFMKRPIWKVPDHSRSASQPRARETSQAVSTTLQPPSQRPSLLNVNRSESQTSTLTMVASSRPSLEGGRPSQIDIVDDSLYRARSAQPRSRPSSAYVTSNLDFLRDHESSRKSSSEARRSLDRRRSQQASPRLAPAAGDEAAIEEKNIDSDLDFLRSTEEPDAVKRRHSRKESSSQHKKRLSIPSISGAKNILAGRFGDAFKRFEQSSGDESKDLPRTPDREDISDRRMLSLVPASDAASDSPSRALDESQELPPDMRREVERRRLAEEEDRVAAAAAEYRARVTANGTGGAPPSRADAIKKRVQDILDEGRKSPAPVRKTAEGYGRFTDTPQRAAAEMPETSAAAASLPPRTTSLPKAQPAPTQDTFSSLQQPRTRPQQVPESTPVQSPPSSASIPTARTFPRPSAPPKPKVLQTAQWPPLPSSDTAPSRAPSKPSGLAALLAKDQEGVPEYPSTTSGGQRASTAPHAGPGPISATAATGDDRDGNHWDEAEFSRRYPSLSGIEMVEREIGVGGEGSVREV